MRGVGTDKIPTIYLKYCNCNVLEIISHKKKHTIRKRKMNYRTAGKRLIRNQNRKLEKD